MTKTKTEKATPVAVNIITSKKEIEARSSALKTTLGNAQAETHILACSVLAHVSKHGNINVLTQFLDALPDMIRVNSLSQWFETFGQLSYSAVGGDKPSWRIDRTKKVRLGDAMVKPFWKFKANEGAPYVPLDMGKYIEQQIKILEKDIKAKPHDAFNLDPDPRALLLNSFKGYKQGNVPASH